MSTFDVRQPLSRREMRRALGAGAAVGAAVGFAAFYVAKVMMEREHLQRPPNVPLIDDRGRERGTPARSAPIIPPPPR